MLLGIRPVLDFYTNVKFGSVLNRDIWLSWFFIRPNHCDGPVLTLIINIAYNSKFFKVLKVSVGVLNM
jgi:hypothetical protein